jgi:hypothetical protein
MYVLDNSFFPKVDPGLTFGERYSLDLVRNIAACMIDMIAYRIHLINSIGRCVVQHCGLDVGKSISNISLIIHSVT